MSPLRDIALACLLSSTTFAVVQPAPPPAPGSDDFDWLQYTNGEWLKGELKDLQDADVEFESDELDTVTLDFEDLYRFYSGGEHLVGLRSNVLMLGKLRIEGNVATVEGEDGVMTFRRDQIRSVISGAKSEWDLWSGKLSLGTEFVRGNVDETSVSTYARIERRAPRSRLSVEYQAQFSEVNGTTTADNQRMLQRYDVYASDRYFFRIPEVELYRDTFQNIALRATPTVSIGYDIVDDADTEWIATGGIGYRYTRFDEVAPGRDRESDDVVLIFSTDYDVEVTGRIDAGAAFSLTLPFGDTDAYTARGELYTEIDLWKDFDLDIRFTWDRVNAPEDNADGTVPDEDEFRLFVGIGWEF